MTGWKYSKERLKQHPYVAKVIRAKKVICVCGATIKLSRKWDEDYINRHARSKGCKRDEGQKHYIIILILLENIKIMMILMKSGKIGAVKLRMQWMMMTLLVLMNVKRMKFLILLLISIKILIPLQIKEEFVVVFVQLRSQQQGGHNYYHMPIICRS